METTRTPTTNSTTQNPLQHQADAQYIWLPIAVLVGIFILAALVYGMSRTRCLSFNCFKRKKVIRYGYIGVDDDSDVPMACGEEIGDDAASACLLSGRLQIKNQTENYETAPAISSINDRRKIVMMPI